MNSTSFGHVPQLDGLRAVAIILVLASHVGLGHLVPGGFGVTVFFFLSGYLITSLLRAEYARWCRISLSGFYFRRVLRIFPPLYITLAFALLLIWLGLLGPLPLNAPAIWFEALFLSNYEQVFGVGGATPIPLWSLAVEEHFYLLFPIVFMVFLGRKSGGAAALWMGAAAALVLAIRFYPVLSGNPDWLPYNYIMTHTRVDSLLFGCILAVWNNPVMDRDAWRPNFWHLAVALGVLAFTLFYRDAVFRETLRYTLQGGAIFVVFSWCLQDRGIVRAVLSSAPARWIGRLSYTAYLVHLVFVVLLAHVAPDLPVLVSTLLVLILTALYSLGMYVWVERPAAKMKSIRIGGWQIDKKQGLIL